MRYWLIKSEPSAFSVEDLAKSSGQRTHWDGVRNYQARNFMRDDMRKGDLAFFYHSSCDPAGIVGIVEIVREAYPDPTAFDRGDKHYDAKSDPENPRWFMVDVKLKRRLKRTISLAELRKFESTRLESFALLRKGNRLSIMPLEKEHWHFVLTLE